MVEVLTLVAVALLAVGVAGTAVPLIPGALASLAGVYLYWWSTGFASPGPLALAAFTLVGLLALFVDWFGGAIGAGAGGASLLTTAAAGIVGFVLLFVAGPPGLLVGVAATVFVLEFVDHRDARQGARTALYATVGVLASTVMQVLLTASMLVAFLALAFVF